jgi:hypothetical protein
MAKTSQRPARDGARQGVSLEQDAFASTEIAAKTQAPIFILRLRPRRGVNPIHALRWLLKASRQRGLRVIDARQETGDAP